MDSLTLRVQELQEDRNQLRLALEQTEAELKNVATQVKQSTGAEPNPGEVIDLSFERGEKVVVMELSRVCEMWVSRL